MANNILKRILHKISRQNELFYIFIFVNLLPSLFLFITEPFNLAEKVALITIPLAFLLIILSLSKRVGLIQMILLPFFFFHAFQLVVFSLFKEDVLAVDMFLNLVTTNASEAGELLSSILIPTISICSLYMLIIILVILSFKKNLSYSTTFLKKNRLVGIGMAIISIPLIFFGKDLNTNDSSIRANIYPINIMYNMFFAANKYVKIKNYPSTSNNFSFNATRKTQEEPEIYVLVIGETSRADNWQIYGYNRQTNPNLSNNKSVLHFHDVITQSNTTHKSVSILLSAASAENYELIYSQKSLITAFKEAGFTTIYLSNQAKNGSFIEYFSKEADHVEHYRSNNSIKNNFDSILLDRLQYYTSSVKNNLLIVVHTYGSHFYYGERYPREFAKYTPDNFTRIDQNNRQRMINAYDNSIIYTDYFLSELSKILVQSGKPASYLFISDHGEDIMDDDRNRFLHASPNPTYYQLRVPLLMWFSEKYKSTYPQKYQQAKENQLKPIASNVVFHTFVDLANIETLYLNQENSLVNPNFKIKPRMYLGDHDNPIHFYKTNLKTQDKLMFEKSNMSIE